MLTAFARREGRVLRLPAAADPGPAIWIDLVDPTEAEVRTVTEATGLHVPTQAEVSEIESSSRLVMRDGILYLSMPLITLTDGPRVVSAGFVLSPERLLTVRFASNAVFDAFASRLPEEDAPSGGGGDMLIALLGAIVDRQADAMERLHAELDTISHREIIQSHTGYRLLQRGIVPCRAPRLMSEDAPIIALMFGADCRQNEIGFEKLSGHPTRAHGQIGHFREPPRKFESGYEARGIDDDLALAQPGSENVRKYRVGGQRLVFA